MQLIYTEVATKIFAMPFAKGTDSLRNLDDFTCASASHHTRCFASRLTCHTYTEALHSAGVCALPWQRVIQRRAQPMLAQLC